MDDVVAMFKTAENPCDQALLAFMLDTGCRAAGVIGLTMTDLDLIVRRALVTEKGSKTRGVTFTTFYC